MANFVRNVRFGLRSLSKNPGFTFGLAGPYFVGRLMKSALYGERNRCSCHQRGDRGAAGLLHSRASRHASRPPWSRCGTNNVRRRPFQETPVARESEKSHVGR